MSKLAVSYGEEIRDDITLAHSDIRTALTEK
jgi:hypothetical protein